MSKKLSISPDVSYMLGVCTLGTDEPSIGVSSTSGEVIERFVRIALTSLEVDPRKLVIGEEGSMKSALFYNSKIKRLIIKALEERERIFKYKNDYSGSYFAGLYDVRGSRRDKGIMLRTRDMVDIIVLERLGIGISNRGKIKRPGEFVEFIKPFSATLQMMK